MFIKDLYFLYGIVAVGLVVMVTHPWYYRHMEYLKSHVQPTTFKWIQRVEDYNPYVILGVLLIWLKYFWD